MKFNSLHEIFDWLDTHAKSNSKGYILEILWNKSKSLFIDGRKFFGHHKDCQSLISFKKDDMVWYKHRKWIQEKWVYQRDKRASFSSSSRGVVKIMILVTTKMEFLISPINIRTIGYQIPSGCVNFWFFVSAI